MQDHQPGSFYCYVPKSPGPIAGLLLSRTKSEKLVHSKLDAVLNSWEDDVPVSSYSESVSSLSRPGSLPQGSLPPPSLGSLPQTQSYVYKNAGLTVKVGLEEVAADLFRMKPYVYSAPDHSAVIVFSGCLHNLSELARRRSKRSARSSAASPHFAADPNNAFASSLERKSSIERSMDLGAMTASTVLGLYLDGQQEGNELIMLSELQGEFAFVIYDNKHKQPFAARDPSGEECLFYHVGDDGAVSFASSRLEIPDGEQPHEWRELPPGHYISGKVPKLHQFALTPQQLVMREMQQEDELDSSSGSGSLRAAEGAATRRRSLALGSADELQMLAAQLQTRTSLDNDSMGKQRALDDVFTLDL
ncbi:hypothetical protein OEZ85_011551 [Tetradesmus obliquus]|uniref:Glutamine amidotransferase type-2 domain-containing protein n=1 Tax=Tetradesmus obliquus TaxID=3088 RepID=A0ABY8TRF2_TETOB|nr:hypothetical protein OEZ85_011551 [Tetradesmus obliquus]